MNPAHEQTIRTYLKGRFRGYRADMNVDDRLDNVVDSIGQFELIEHLETTFGFQVPHEDFHPDLFATIADMGKVIETYAPHA